MVKTSEELTFSTVLLTPSKAEFSSGTAYLLLVAGWVALSNTAGPGILDRRLV